MSERNHDSLEALECRGDFWITMREAVVQAGGNPALVEKCMDVPLRAVVDLLAQNGIRMVFRPEACVEAITNKAQVSRNITPPL